MPIETHTEAVGVFQDAESLRIAADELMNHGFDRADLSLLAGQQAVEEKLGHSYSNVGEILDDPNVATQAYSAGDSFNEAKAAIVGGLFFIGAMAAAGVSIANGSSLTDTITGMLAAGGTGGFIGFVLALLMGRHRARSIKSHFARGGLVLWVRTIDQGHERRAIEILEANGAEAAHLHQLPKVNFGGQLNIYGYLHWLGDLPSRLRQQS